MDCGKPIPLRLNQNIEHNTVLIDCSPEIVSDAVDLEKNFVEVPLITGSSTPSSEAIGILFAELIAPTPDRLVADQHSTGRHQLLHVAKADAETEVEPNALRDDLSRESMATVQAVRHSSRIASAQLDSAVWQECLSSSPGSELRRFLQKQSSNILSSRNPKQLHTHS